MRQADEYLALFDQKGICVEKTGKYFGLIDKLKFFNYFGMRQLVKLNTLLQGFVKDFSRL